jgi:hypothetical protein
MGGLAPHRRARRRADADPTVVDVTEPRQWPEFGPSPSPGTAQRRVRMGVWRRIILDIVTVMPWPGAKRLSRRRFSARRAAAASRVGLLHGFGSLAAVLALVIQFFLPFMPMLQTADGTPLTREQIVDSWTKSSICQDSGMAHRQHPASQGQLPCPECPICQLLHQTASLLPPAVVGQALTFSFLGRLEPIIETRASPPSDASPSQPRAPPALT